MEQILSHMDMIARTVTVDEAYWPKTFPEWNTLRRDQQEELKQSVMKALKHAIDNGKPAPEGVHFGYTVFTNDALVRIIEERGEQVKKHGFTTDADDRLVNDELQRAALAVLTEDPFQWPENMDKRIYRHAITKHEPERLVVVAALLAAEVDRLLRARAATAHLPVPKIEVGGRVRVHRNVYDRLLAATYSEAEAEHLSTLADRCGTVEAIDYTKEDVYVTIEGIRTAVVLPKTCLIPLNS